MLRINDPLFSATVSDFRLDAFEITVGRFRKFVATYAQDMTPPAGGKNPNDVDDTGWSAAWNAKLPGDKAALITAVKCDVSNLHTWTDAAGDTVGSVSAGNGRWGHADLAGSVSEFLQDYLSIPYTQDTCQNCSSKTVTPQRAVRGGTFDAGAFYLMTTSRSSHQDIIQFSNVGSRCARRP